jgi:Mce-associated membrane protein
VVDSDPEQKPPRPTRKRTSPGAATPASAPARAKRAAPRRPAPAREPAKTVGLAQSADPVADEPAVPAEQAAAEGGSRPSRLRRRLRRRLPLGAAALVTVGLLVAVIVLALVVSGDGSRQDARRSAIAAARGYAADIASYDYRSLDKDFARVTAHSTGTFRTQFAKASKDLRPLIEQYHATAKGKVIAVGLSQSSTDRATAVVFVDQTVTNDNSKTPRVDRNRMTMDLVRRNGTWLISGVQLV